MGIWALLSSIASKLGKYLYRFSIISYIFPLYISFLDSASVSLVSVHVADCSEFLPEKLMWSIATQILLALHYCHTGGAEPPILEGSLSQNSNNNSSKSTGQIVLHRDIKPENSIPPLTLTHTHIC